ncbi:hypothetical protein C5167_003828 [Papaver somniferum]|uniref:SHSP domain-containing protein n=1 Tax=Papaver somniferum TaxID=3469 RepID=A0A4Y7L2J0_PAPSO|nr:hypothetical protein C5167_003828 [Papaver somniferum]
MPRSELSKETSQLANTRIDWKQTPKAHIFRADLLGVKKEEVKRSRETEEKNDKWHRVECSIGKLLRRFRLPENTKMDEVKAAMENGFLTVIVPKVEEKKPEVKSIQISDVWDPFQDFPFSSSALSMPRSELSKETSQLANTRIDWKETPEAHIFRADLPGVKKEEVKVEVEEGRVLQISGERSRETEEKNDKWHRVECSSGKFLRRFRLPENTKMDEVKAAMENGVLTVTVPKVEEKKPEVKSIQISG